jgi:hypothetical protein
LNKSVRKAIAGIAGFALTFGFAYLFMAVYAVSQPSMWLPVLFAIAFYGILTLFPRVAAALKFGLSLVFASGSCLLWMASGSMVFLSHSTAFTLAFKTLLMMGGGFGLLIAVVSLARTSRDDLPKLIPILMLMAFGWLISYFSSSHGGATPMVDWVVEHLGLSRHTAEIFVIGLRKTIHFSFYGAIAATAYVAALRNGASKPNCYSAAGWTALAYACFDELRQSTQIDRGGSPVDVLLDMAGAGAAVLLIATLGKAKTGRRPKAAKNSTTL